MEEEHTQHLDSIVKEATFLIATKYKAGQEEHGGRLWEKKHLINMALDEAVDQVVYLLTLKKQIEDAGVVLGITEDEA